MNFVFFFSNRFYFQSLENSEIKIEEEKNNNIGGNEILEEPVLGGSLLPTEKSKLKEEKEDEHEIEEIPNEVS